VAVGPGEASATDVDGATEVDAAGLSVTADDAADAEGDPERHPVRITINSGAARRIPAAYPKRDLA
jgi:hypothetical protein